jgi:hypothetical protein
VGQVHVNVGQCSVVQIPVLQLLGVDFCNNPVLAHKWRNSCGGAGGVNCIFAL